MRQPIEDGTKIKRGLIGADDEGVWIDGRLLWLLMFLGGSAVMGLASWSLAFQHELPEFALAVFVFWLALFGAIAWFTRRLGTRLS